MSDKEERKELKQPDEFQVVAGKAMAWLLEKKTLVLGAVAALVLLSVGIWAASAFAESREAQAGGELAEALEIAGRPIAGEGAAPGQDTFATKEARTAALITALEKVRADHPSSNAARTATVQLGFQKLKAGDAAAAQTLLAEYLASSPKDDALRVSALESLGAAQEKQGKFDEAKATYAKLAEAGAEGEAAYQQARLLLVQKKPEAKEALEKVAKDFPKDGVATEAQRRLELAALPPPPPPGSLPPPEAEAPVAPAPKGKAVAPKAPVKGAKPPVKKG